MNGRPSPRLREAGAGTAGGGGGGSLSVGVRGTDRPAPASALQASVARPPRICYAAPTVDVAGPRSWVHLL